MEDPEPVTRTNSLLIPTIALGYVPFVIFLSYVNDDTVTADWSLLVESACFGFLFLPLYAIYLVLLAWQRFKDGTLTWFDAIFHIISFIVPLGFCVLAISVAGMGSPA